MRSLIALAASALALTAYVAPAHATTTVLYSGVDQSAMTTTPLSFTFTAEAPSTTLSFGGYNYYDFDIVTYIELLAAGSDANLVTNAFVETRASAGSGAFIVGDPWPINGFEFGGAGPDYDVFSETINTVVGHSYTLNFDLLVGHGAPNGFFVSATNVLTAVPEPATWAVLLTGFAAVGAALRHRRRPTTGFA